MDLISFGDMYLFSENGNASCRLPRSDFRRLLCQFLVVSLIAVAVGGCIIIPLPKSDYTLSFDERAKEQMAAFIKPSVTTKQEVIERLGPSVVDLSDWNILAYQPPYEHVRDVLFLYALPRSTIAGGFDVEVVSKRVLFISLDGETVSHNELIMRPCWNAAFGTIRSEARAWAEKKGMILPPEDMRFEQKSIPEGKGLIYVYRLSPKSLMRLSCPGPLLVTLDKRMGVEMKGRSYWTYVVDPGEYWLKADRWPHAGTSLYVETVPAYVKITARPGEAVFVRTVCGGGDGKLRSTAEVVPEETGIKELAGARLAW